MIAKELNETMDVTLSFARDSEDLRLGYLTPVNQLERENDGLTYRDRVGAFPLLVTFFFFATGVVDSDLSIPAGDRVGVVTSRGTDGPASVISPFGGDLISSSRLSLERSPRSRWIVSSISSLPVGVLSVDPGDDPGEPTDPKETPDLASPSVTSSAPSLDRGVVIRDAESGSRFKDTMV